MVIYLAKRTKDSSFYVGKPGAEQPIYFGINSEAVEAWHLLGEAMSAHKVWNCKDNPYFYMDYDGKGFEDDEGRSIIAPLTDAQAEDACYGCPLLKQCFDFAVANDEQFGIWGGIIFDKKDTQQLDIFLEED
jgi:hypothetical protein